MSSQRVAATRSANEIAEAIRSLSPADWVRLRRVAGRYARPNLAAEDLLQEAFVRAIDGSRSCPAHVDVVRFLAEAMRSIADGEFEKVKNRPALVAVDAGDGQSEAMTHPDPSPGIEDRIICAERDAQMVADILSLFEDDPAARDIVEGTMEDMTPEELRELTGLDKTAYDSKRRLIRRRIDKRYPEGWKP